MDNCIVQNLSNLALKMGSFCCGTWVKNLPANTGDAGEEGSIPGSGTTGVRNGKPLQYSCLGNSKDRGSWGAAVHGGHKQSGMTGHAHINCISIKMIENKEKIITKRFNLHALSFLHGGITWP